LSSSSKGTSKNRSYLKNKSKVLFPILSEYSINKNFVLNKSKSKDFSWKDDQTHKGTNLYKIDKYKILNCKNCGFIHAVPIPKKDYLEKYYLKKYYSQKRKLNYFKEQNKNLTWWKNIFKDRINKFEKILGHKGTILDIGCGPGFFLKYAKSKGWKVMGIEPSLRAYEHAKKKLNLNIERLNIDQIASIGDLKFDVIYSHGVLEHLRKPIEYINLLNNYLKKKGIVFTSVANDFNLFQYSYTYGKKIKPWWIIPPEHINYFNVNSIQKLFHKRGFRTKDITTSFPIDMFLLMGIDYIAKKNLGKDAHDFRKKFEENLKISGLEDLLKSLQENFTKLNIGRQIDLIVQKK
tara:strand:+ start:405 stop:1451 length:1047 start_codon:yes stop_codon:yes gene_type:complete